MKICGLIKDKISIKTKKCQYIKELLIDFGKGIFQKFIKPILVKNLKCPEKIISIAFQELSPVSEEIIVTSLCCSFNALRPTPERIISNYCQGAVLFGKNNSDYLHWKIPSERSIITAETAHLPRKKRVFLKKNDFDIKFNGNFIGVIEACKRENGSWITEPLVQLYKELFESGFVWCIETYHQDVLVGGSWGISVGGVCGGMSTFHSVDQAGSVIASILVEKVMNHEIKILDCGAHKPHFAQFGAIPIAREKFVEKVAQNINLPSFCFKTDQQERMSV